MGRGSKIDDLERLVALSHGDARWVQWGGGPMFGPGRGRARRGDVRQAILTLLAEGGRNGYGLMQTIEERSGGRWRPSPGSVYPTLAQLEDEGLIRAADRDGTKVYELTDAGRERAGGASPDPFAGDGPEGEAPNLRGQMRHLALAVAQVARAGSPDEAAQAAELLERTRCDLYRILAGERA